MEMGGARALVYVPLDRCRFSRHFGISHILMTSAVFELWGFSLFTAGWVELGFWFKCRWIGGVSAKILVNYTFQ